MTAGGATVKAAASPVGSSPVLHNAALQPHGAPRCECSTLGALAGSLIPFDTKGLDFALTALFIVLLVEQARNVRRAAPYLVAAGATGLALLAVGPANLLIVAILASILGILPFRKALS